MALAHIWRPVEVDGSLVGLELAGRYSIEVPLARMDSVRTFGATDRWLDREVALALSSAGGRRSLIDSGKAVARIKSPHVVNVFACGHYEDQSFVVFERPCSTLAIVTREAQVQGWDQAQVTRAAQELVIGLVELNRAGVPTNGLHLGAIGIDDGGRIQVSPWPLSDRAPHIDESSVLSDMALVTSVLEMGERDGLNACVGNETGRGLSWGFVD